MWHRGWKVIWTGMAGLLLGSGLARAASFDCAKAVKPQERAICSDASLSLADEQMAKAYKAGLNGVSLQAQEKMRADQVGWLKWVGTICRADAGRELEELAACMSLAYASRIETLQKGVVKLGGVVFFHRSGYFAGPDGIDVEDGQAEVYHEQGQYPGFGTLHLQWPEADGLKSDNDRAVWRAWEGAVRALVYKTAEVGEQAEPNQEEVGVADVEVTAEVKSVAGGRVMTFFARDEFGHGAAHPNADFWNDHWMIQEQREMVAADIFRPGTQWEAGLARRVYRTLEREHPDEGLPEDGPQDKTLLSIVRSKGNWTITKAGLEISLQDYILGHIHVGAGEDIELRWSTLKAYTVTGFRAGN